VADTHAVIWYLQGSTRISTAARAALDETTGAGLPVLVSTMTLVELRYLVQKGTFTEGEATEFDEVLGAEDSGFEIVPVDDDVARAVGGSRVRQLPTRSTG
jgi:PIN domain nuclease of toxin-antitoxin system